ncbi:GNAT family N-acetyltransferase [Halobacillus salinarum]|uniref:GNAT family N-acetyltransferase n=1 Tax=Halobacillus salinarum TaxID=2932257 RepID=A0ABY4EH70_9BACI|nr:GNAT family N-acetyltransferase [Halobacillus salinarum]UOQ43792.1 GNAT family N-acetyltransferase [Halobacillus salinarum]
MGTVNIRSFQESDFSAIQQLNEKEEWNGLVDRAQDTLYSWINSEPALIATDGEEIIGYLRGLTDGLVTLFICEVLVREDYRNQGICEQLIQAAHECYPRTRVEMLAASSSQEYYAKKGFRPFYGFRKSAEEMHAGRVNS